MGVLQRFERRLEGMVEGAFARAFKSELQPVEVASAVQREMDDRAAIVAQGRTLVPNDFVVELADSDHDRLDVYADSLGVELANLARSSVLASAAPDPLRAAALADIDGWLATPSNDPVSRECGGSG